MVHTVSRGVIRTARLDLVPLGLAEAAAIVAGHRPRGARWALGYPTEGTLVSAGILVTAESEGRPLGPFGPRQLIQRERRLVVGDCGFEGPPDSRGDVRVAFGVSPDHRRQGYACEALVGLFQWAHEQTGVQRVIADAALTNLASIRVLESAGMHRTHADESLVYYAA